MKIISLSDRPTCFELSVDRQNDCVSAPHLYNLARSFSLYTDQDISLFFQVSECTLFFIVWISGAKCCGFVRIKALTRWHVQLHPDVNKDTDANEKFMSVRLAYEVSLGYLYYSDNLSKV